MFSKSPCKDWTTDHIVKFAGDKMVCLKRQEMGSVEWARLENAESVTVRDFVQHMHTKYQDRYLFDWSLPVHSPELAEQITIPPYFAEDMLRKTPEGSLYRESWPSLFVASKGLVSELHVDSFGSHFWMALFQGQKKWEFFPKEQAHLLYPKYHHSLDPVFQVNLPRPSLSQFPAFGQAVKSECILKPGEILFVPEGSPHRVTNLTDSVAISGNFVDETNLNEALHELRMCGYKDTRAGELAAILKEMSLTTL
eukprot:m.158608 g.158608  ORF g.158608 m.158608 type:complete len:253 (+) comp24764_c0_seq4:702-1460(+)